MERVCAAAFLEIRNTSLSKELILFFFWLQYKDVTACLIQPTPKNFYQLKIMNPLKQKLIV